jgi:hypothetical protein
MALGAPGGQSHETEGREQELHLDEEEKAEVEEEGTTRSLAALTMLSSAPSPPSAATDPAAPVDGEGDGALVQALAGYCSVAAAASASPAAGEEELLPPQQTQRQQEDGVAHLNRVLLQVQRRKRLDEVVGLMGPYLTSEDGKVCRRVCFALSGWTECCWSGACKHRTTPSY